MEAERGGRPMPFDSNAEINPPRRLTVLQQEAQDYAHAVFDSMAQSGHSITRLALEFLEAHGLEDSIIRRDPNASKVGGLTETQGGAEVEGEVAKLGHDVPPLVDGESQMARQPAAAASSLVKPVPAQKP